MSIGLKRKNCASGTPFRSTGNGSKAAFLRICASEKVRILQHASALSSSNAVISRFACLPHWDTYFKSCAVATSAGNLANVRFVPASSAASNPVAPSRMAPCRFASRSRAPNRFAPWRFACSRLAPWRSVKSRSAPFKTVSFSSAPCRLVSVRSAPSRLTRERSACRPVRPLDFTQSRCCSRMISRSTLAARTAGRRAAASPLLGSPHP